MTETPRHGRTSDERTHYNGFLDEAEHGEERMTLIRTARNGDREAFMTLNADFEAWRQSRRERPAFLKAVRPSGISPADEEFGTAE